MAMPRLIFTAGLLTLSVAACASTGNEIICPALLTFGDPLLYPMPEATNVPTMVGELILASGEASLTNNAYFDITTAGGTRLARVRLSAPSSPLPSPLATPYPSAQPVALVVPVLPASTGIVVQQEYDMSVPCPSAIGDSGSFTTGP